MVSGASPVSPVVWLSTSEPSNDVPIFSVVVPPVPIQTFFSSIDPSSRVLVKVQTTVELSATVSLPLASTATAPFWSVQASVVE